MARYRMEGSSLVGEYGVEYVVNPSGTVWGIHEDHPSPLWPRRPGDTVKTLVELAERREDGWRLATEDEIRKHVKDTGEWLPPELEKVKPEPRREGANGDTQSSAYEEGQAAALAGDDRKSPYDGRSKNNKDWLLGYDNAGEKSPGGEDEE